jgi:DNA topoisomerase-1
MKLVVVESPAKAKTINKYLGSDYEVLASYGHVRDLPPKDGSVRPEEDFAMSWEVDDRSVKRVKDIAKAAKKADAILLATDPDREGEAISWHVQSLLEESGVIRDKDVSRVVFHEITRKAIQEAVAHPRKVNNELVEAYLARRALDYLVGFKLSPVLWRKLPGSRSAGRVQSVALRLVCQRESEIEAFTPREYWSIAGIFRAEDGRTADAHLTHLNGQKLDRFDISNEEGAHAIVTSVEANQYTISDIEKRQTTRNPSPPFTTSTLQQEASRKLRLPTSITMRIAQKLYEGFEVDGETTGLITYMRTDSVALSTEAIEASRTHINEKYGKDYLPSAPRQFRSKAKNAQEAHEAIRPTDINRTPELMSKVLSGDDLRLYELIWRRAVACQMASAKIDQTAIVISANDNETKFRATGSVIAFDGFLTLYQESHDEISDDETGKILAPFKKFEAVSATKITPEQHFTQPPPRYSEASLVKAMEELGIGRPSTYASILQVLQDRNYVRLDSRRFVPEDRGRLVTSFLENFFSRYVEYDFTADLEQRLDDVSNGQLGWRALLHEFWAGFNDRIDQASELSITDVINAIDEQLSPHFFPSNTSTGDPRLCPACNQGRLSLRLGRHGAFIGCNRYPECKHTRPLAIPNSDEPNDAIDGPKILGEDPGTGLQVILRRGPYGHYVQLGEQSDEKGAPKPKRASLPKGQAPSEMTLERALALLSLPRVIGDHPESGKVIKAGLGRFGPYLHHDGGYTSLPKDEDVLTVGLNRAVTILAEAKEKGRGGASTLKNLGKHPAGGGEIIIKKGRFGPYVNFGKIRASLPKGADLESFSIEEAVELISKKTGVKKQSKAPKRSASKSTNTKTKAKPKKKTKAKVDET